ncbi:putative transposase of ISThsp18, IS1182 family [Methylocaldum marinum]|uniref:Putative transposase of ISThsp18, IS1182 family n=1 Tax=Methylocaldum marinum TaxID=1432792 RepID=A0A250KT20_9GAMM|nr:putative transposase of ISThsp18, IS1182 family [Methylocaldum marinum]
MSEEFAPIVRKVKCTAVDGRTARGKGYAISLKCRKRIEEAFGWLKTVGLAQDPPQRLGQGVRAGDVVLRGL